MPLPLYDFFQQKEEQSPVDAHGFLFNYFIKTNPVIAENPLMLQMKRRGTLGGRDSRSSWLLQRIK
jgi:hypothetical protein